MRDKGLKPDTEGRRDEGQGAQTRHRKKKRSGTRCSIQERKEEEMRDKVHKPDTGRRINEEQGAQTRH